MAVASDDPAKARRLHLHRICTASATHMHCICTASALQALAARKRGQKPSSVTGPPRRGMRSAPAPRSSLPLMKGAMRRDSLLAAARVDAEREARARHRDSKRLANQARAAPHSAWHGASKRPSYHQLHAASLTHGAASHRASHRARRRAWRRVLHNASRWTHQLGVGGG